MTLHFKLCITLRPVSYTHLDVYKRQRQIKCMALIGITLCITVFALSYAKTAAICIIIHAICKISCLHLSLIHILLEIETDISLPIPGMEKTFSTMMLPPKISAAVIPKMVITGIREFLST